MTNRLTPSVCSSSLASHWLLLCVPRLWEIPHHSQMSLQHKSWLDIDFQLLSFLKSTSTKTLLSSLADSSPVKSFLSILMASSNTNSTPSISSRIYFSSPSCYPHFVLSDLSREKKTNFYISLKLWMTFSVPNNATQVTRPSWRNSYVLPCSPSCIIHSQDASDLGHYSNPLPFVPFSFLPFNINTGGFSAWTPPLLSFSQHSLSLYFTSLFYAFEISNWISYPPEIFPHMYPPEAKYPPLPVSCTFPSQN